MKLDLTRLPVGEMIIGFLVVVLGITFAIAFTYVDSDEGGEEGGEPTPALTPVTGSADISMGDNFFDPSDFALVAGDTVTFNLTNDGLVTHNMHVSVDGQYAANLCETGGDAPCSDPNAVTPGTAATLTFAVPADAAGTEIPFRCDFHPVEMVGTLTVVAAE